ncbi:hypothetical protein JG688_00015984 [Phytophthora aleatoria]|uniref:Uncharacterized protein n=1 Tax=Phytophthora aleatoria TaxID=2496075 RepID=A0A8J5IUV0_9STRA|nr:hypothetical protein JG688_00015984 [Phytophthora aleatoria]
MRQHMVFRTRSILPEAQTSNPAGITKMLSSSAQHSSVVSRAAKQQERTSRLSYRAHSSGMSSGLAHSVA